MTMISTKKFSLLAVCVYLINVSNSIAQNQQILIPYQNESTRLWGYVDENKNVKIPYKYTAAEKFSDGLAKIYFEND